MTIKGKMRRGWAWPMNSRKAHYFLDNEVVSLCERWMFIGEREDDKHDSPDNCVICKKRHAKIQSTGEPK